MLLAVLIKGGVRARDNSPPRPLGTAVLVDSDTIAVSCCVSYVERTDSSLSTRPSPAFSSYWWWSLVCLDCMAAFFADVGSDVFFLPRDDLECPGG